MKDNLLVVNLLSVFVSAWADTFAMCPYKQLAIISFCDLVNCSVKTIILPFFLL